jgi:hypothetical protein
MGEALNTDTSLTWIPQKELVQGIYAFFISSPNRNSSESPFFALQIANSTSSSLSTAAKVGIGLGIPFALTMLAFVALLIRLSSLQRAGREREDGTVPEDTPRKNNEMIETGRREPIELGGTSIGPELATTNA